MSTLRCVTAALTALFCLSTAAAGNIDLSTVPGRDSVQLTIYNSADLTLVRERRTLTFAPGANPLQFSWSNTLIDPTSVELRFPGAGDRLRLVDTTFPHDKPQMLYWNVQSEVEGEAAVEISYFTSGLTWTADYTVIANPEESSAAIDGFIRVHNRSGEAYPDARVRVVVGTINLVEKIAQLARVPVADVPHLERGRRDSLRLFAAKSMMAAESDAAVPGASGQAAAPKAIVKEGLSEYFIFAIEGTESIPDGWSKRLRSFQVDALPMQVRYRYRPQQYGEQLVQLYVSRNDAASGLGTTPLPGGEVRIFRDAGEGRLSYRAAQRINYVPVGEKLELNLGPDPDVVFERELLGSRRSEIWLRLKKSNRFYRAGDGLTVIERDGEVAGWDAHALYVQRIYNFTRRPIAVEFRQRFAGDATLASRLTAERHDFQSADLTTAVAAGERQDVYLEVLTREGRNAKQNRLILERRNVPGPSY